MKIYLISILLLMFQIPTEENIFRKYDIEKGILKFALNHPLKVKTIEFRVYFTEYGATEYFEYINEEDFPTQSMLKKDSLQYLFVTDSMTVTTNRNFDYIIEKLIKRKDSKLTNDDLILLNRADTLIKNRKCELFDFKLGRTGQIGKAALWKGIPIWVNSQWEKGLVENIEIIEIDLSSDIPIEKTQIMDYVDVE